MRYLFTWLATLGWLSLLPAQTFPQAACVSTCTGNLGDNIFPNGDFGAGAANIFPTDPQVAPDYIYSTTPPPNDGYYTLANYTGGWNYFAEEFWIDIPDHGPEPDGYMMVVNATLLPGLFFEKKVAVCENTLYEFSIDVISLFETAEGSWPILPDLAFEIDGQVVCASGQVPNDESWHTLRFSFTTPPGASEVALALRNNAPGGGGNDLAIDNISFRACGPAIDLPATIVYCPGQPLVLQADLNHSPYPTAVYQWQASNNQGLSWTNLPLADTSVYPIATPTDGRQYRLLVAGSSANLALPHCRAVSFPVETLLDAVAGFAISGADTLLCNGAPAVLEAGDFAAYAWSDGSSAATLTTGLPGWYAVTVTSAYGCSGSDSLEVFDVYLSAEAQAEDPSCFGQASGLIEILHWEGNGGNVQFSLNGSPPQSQPWFDALPAGAYELEARDVRNCRVNWSFTLADPPPFHVFLGPDRQLAAGDSVVLSAATNYVPVVYDWQFTGGAALSCTGCLSPRLRPFRSGWVLLQAHNATGCVTTDSLFLAVDPLLDLYVPNVFHPGGNAEPANGYFTVFPSPSTVEVRHFAVYDRWGSLVFFRQHQPPGAADLRWNGEAGNGRPAPGGVYVWSVELLFSDGVARQYRGEVLLLP